MRSVTFTAELYLLLIIDLFQFSAGNKPCPCWEKVKVEKDPKTGEMKQKLIKMRLPSDATTSGKPFLVRDFIVSKFIK